MESFSERYGYAVKKAVQFESMDEALRNSIWNFIESEFLEVDNKFFRENLGYSKLAEHIRDDFHRKLVRNLPDWIPSFVEEEHTWFIKSPWYRAYDYCEFFFNLLENSELLAGKTQKFNRLLERDKAAYRLVGGRVTPIIDSPQLEALESAIAAPTEFKAASEHLRTALSLYSDRKKPDYRNSVKEAISAVEATVKIISKDDKATLGEALRSISSNKPMHEAFRQALLKLYGYTSDEKGIRHALLEETNVDEADARFMLIACSAFVTYLVSRS